MMKISIQRLSFLMLFIAITGEGLAQNQDSILLSNGKLKLNDSILFAAKAMIKKSDSLYLKEAALHKAARDIYIVETDTLPLHNLHKSRALSDSLHRTNNLLLEKTKAAQLEKNSLFRAGDSLTRKSKLSKAKQDSLFKKQASLFRKTKSLQFKQDSLLRMQKQLAFRDHANKVRIHRLDSLKSLNWRKDSTRIKVHLEKLKSNLQRMKEDSARQKTNMEKKIISMELACDKNSTVSIGNMGRKIIVKNTEEEKVKIETTIFVAEGFNEKELNPGKTLNITLEKKKNEVQLRRADTSMTVSGNSNNKSTDVKDRLQYKINYKSPLTIYVPAGVKLTIESRYNDVTITDNVITVSLDLINANLQMQDAGKAVIKSKYGSVKAGMIKEADIDILNCNFVSGNLEKLQINSKYSNVKFESSGAADIKSVSDQYKISNANDIIANKSFGKLDIAKLENSIVLKGSSADMDIRAIEASVKLIQVDNKYAAIKLPVENLPNYSLKFDGINSNIFPPLEKPETVASDNSIKPNPLFSKTVGDLKKDFTSLLVNCASCSVDFR